MTLRYPFLLMLLVLAPVVPLSAATWLGEAPAAGNEPVDVAEIAASPEDWVERSVLVSGRITDVCTNRGCWAVFESGGEMLRIIARDHGFAIPAEARGEAVAHGVVTRHELSAEAARHMVEADGADEGLLAEPVEYRLVAEGVRLLEAVSD